MTKKRVAVLISGRGSNLQCLIEAADASYEIVLVISNIQGADGLRKAQAAQVQWLSEVTKRRQIGTSSRKCPQAR